MKQLRVEQHKNEPADMFAFRALAIAIPRMDRQSADAMWHYLWKRAGAELLSPAAGERDDANKA